VAKRVSGAATTLGVTKVEVGDLVEVRSRFSHSWVTGFEVAAVVDSGYRLRRTSDGTELPDVTSDADLRPVPAAE
jgi:hypothetical protein